MSLENPTRIVRAEVRHIPEIAGIHDAELPKDFCTALGRRFLEGVFYPALLAAPETLGLCAMDGPRVVGFVLFHSDRGSIGKFARLELRRILESSLPHLCRPEFMRYLLEIGALLFLRRRNPHEEGVELSYIAIRRSHQKLDIGSALIREGLRRLTDGGAKTCWVKTLRSMKGAVEFYEKLGYRVHDRYLGRIFLSLSLTTPVTGRP